MVRYSEYDKMMTRRIQGGETNVDEGVFDRLARQLARLQSRRATVAALLGAAAFGITADSLPARDRRKHKRKRRSRGQTSEASVVSTCYAGTNCVPGRGRTNAGCDFSGTSIFVGLNARGAILSDANFTGADLLEADLRGAVLSGSCFVDADLTGAIIDNTTVRDSAIFCNTAMPDGTIDNSGCGRQDACCPCPGGACITAPGDQPDCEGVLRRAGCSFGRDPQSGIDRWQCFPGANLRGADLSGCRLMHAQLVSVQMQDAFLNRAIFNDANLRSARLDGATMDSVSVVNTRFDNAVLFRASMADNDQRNAVFQGADLRLRDWARTRCPDGITTGASHPTCCNNLNGSTAKFCGRV